MPCCVGSCYCVTHQDSSSSKYFQPKASQFTATTAARHCSSGACVLHRAFCSKTHCHQFHCVIVALRPAHVFANLQAKTFLNIVTEIDKEDATAEVMADLKYAATLAQQGHVKNQQVIQKVKQAYFAKSLKSKYGAQP